MIMPFIKRPKRTLEQEIAEGVGKYGLSSVLKGWEGVRESHRTGGAFSQGILGVVFGRQAEKALKILGKAPYAPGPTLENRTPEEAGEFTKKQRAKRYRRRYMRITGELEPMTKGRTLLG